MEDEHPHGELGDRFVAILQALDGATLDDCMDGPCGVHLGFQVVDSTHRVDILVCGWLGLMRHGSKKGVLICDGSNYLLREAVPQLPKGEVVTRFRAHPDKLAVRLSFANGDKFEFRPWPNDADEFLNSICLWTGKPYDSTLLDGIFIYSARLEPMSNVGSTYIRHQEVMARAG